MFINKRFFSLLILFLVMTFFMFSSLFQASRLGAATTEVEKEDEDVTAPPTPMEDQSVSEAASGTSLSNDTRDKDIRRKPTTEMDTDEDSSQAVTDNEASDAKEKDDEGTGVSSDSVADDEEITFDYFLKSGFVASDESQVPAVGKVIGSFEGQDSYSVPKKTYIELFSNKVKVQPGDLLVVFKGSGTLEESHSGFSARLIKNEAIVKVLEVQRRRCLIQVVKSFDVFRVGDRVKLYNDEVSRWKKSQIEKAPSNHPIKCYVAGGDFGRESWNKTEFIVLTAGAKKGVVEGLVFELREFKDTGLFDENLHIPRGTAEVFYVGSNYSMARIITNSEPIFKGFEAFYKPQ